MNSKLLEEAIVDAEALREAALKNAEQAILDKYAPEVKLAIESLLEQEEPMPAMAMPPLGGDMAKEEMDVPLAATDGEKLCPCPDDEEVITISIGDLEKAISDVARANASPAEETPAPPTDMGMEAPMEEPAAELPPAGEEVPPPEEEEEEPLALQEDFEISEDLIASILSESEELEEEVELDEEVVEETSCDDDREKMEEEKEDEVMQENKSLSSQNSKLLVEQKKTLNENKLLTEKLEKLLKQHNKLLEENKQTKKTALDLSKHLEQSNLLNAKLYYKNQALGSDSLNERQKDKIVEAVSKADSVDEVKMIYETLCNAVGTFDNKAPKSLSEAVEKRGGMVIKPRQETNSNTNPLYNKWQKIAGIKK